jgi:type I restriction enzyme M protein
MKQRDAMKAQNGADIHSNLSSIEEILRGSSHALTIFKPKAIQGLEIFAKQSKPYLNCYATGKDRPAKPEEIVRQLYVKKLMDDYGYPAERIAIEKPVQFGSAVHECVRLSRI